MKHKLLNKLLFLLLCILGGANFNLTWADTSTLTFSAACGGSGTADDGASWTVTSDGTESSHDSSKGIHYGTNSAQVKYIQLSTSDISGTITKVVVNASTASGVSATVSVNVGGAAFGGDPQSLSSSAANYTFDGSASGEIVVRVEKPSKAAKALYVKSIIVTYDSSVLITSISMAPSASVEIGGTTTLTPTVLPANTTETVAWESSDTDVATVSEAGVVTGVAAGTATITAKSPSDATIKAECTVTVNAPTEVATPTISVATGTYNVAQSVELSCVTDDATIRYTTDGTDPTSSSTVYSSAISVDQSMTIKAKAFKDGLTDSGIASATYTLKCVAPTFSPAASTLPYGSEITLSSTTEGSTIYYTTNGDEPTTSSTAYDSSNKPAINADQTIKAIAVKTGWSNSDVSSAEYDVKVPDAPTLSLEEGMVSQGASLTISSEEGTTIRYTTDGTTPTSSVGTEYTSPIILNSTQTVKAVAYDGGGNCSSVVTKAYTVFVGDVVTFTAGTDKGKSTNSGSSDEVSKSGVTISSTNAAFLQDQYRMYSGSKTTISVTSGLIKRIEFTGESGYPISKLSANTGTLTTKDYDGVWEGTAASVEFTASAQARATLIKVYVANTAAPTFSVAEGEYSEAKSVEISCATDGATIYYTTDGTTPTSSSKAYSSAIPVTETTTLKAIAIKDEVESDVASATYTMNRPDAPVFDVVTCVFDAAFDLHLSAADGTTIYYTTDGTTPTSSNSTYSTKVAVSAATTTVKAIAVKNGLTSDVASETYTYDSRITPTFTLSTTNIDLKVNDSSSAVTLTTNSDATPSFTCDDPHVTLTGTGNSRTISANAAGTYTVNVSVTESATYKDAAGIVTVNVTKKATTMVITTAFDDGKDLYTASEGLIEGVVKYNDADLSPQPTITYSSSDETVATVDEDGIITFKKAGTTTITASYAGDDEYEECKGTYNLDLVDTTPQEMVVNISLNNTFFGCEPFTSYPASSPTSYEGTKDKITVTYAKGTGSGYYCNANGIRLYLGGSLTFEAPLGYVITSIAMSGESGFEEGLTNPEAVTTWTGKSNSVTITGETKSGNTRKNMTGATVSLAETVTIGSAGYTTYVAKHNISFPDGLTAYISTSKTSETLTLTEKASVPQGTPIILEGSAGTYALPTITTSPEDVSGNLLQASDGSVNGDGSTIYALGVGKTGANEGKVGFYLVGSGVQVPAGKAYLVVGGGAKEFLTFDFDDEATSIEETLSDSTLKDENIYNLAGQRIQKMQKGINIVNGKKVLR